MLPNASTKVQSYAGQFNVQVVRGRVTTRCLWNACRALAVGLTLLTLGTTMAVVGYYAEQLSEADETRGNATVHVRYEARGFHLNNLSYAGPVVMGIGGFIVVAACVMTFEARDSAAKVMPARLKPSTAPSSVRSTPRASRSTIRRPEKRAASSQTRRSVHEHLSRHLGKVVSKSPSAPSLVEVSTSNNPLSPSRPLSLLSANLLPRQALSMDCSHVDDVVLDASPGHPLPNGLEGNDWRTTLTIQDETARKKRITRQKTLDPATGSKKHRTSSEQRLQRSASTSTQTRPPCCAHRIVSNAPLRRQCSMGPTVSPSHQHPPACRKISAPGQIQERSPTRHQHGSSSRRTSPRDEEPVCRASRSPTREFYPYSQDPCSSGLSKSSKKRHKERTNSQTSPNKTRTVPWASRSLEQPCSRSAQSSRKSSPNRSPSHEPLSDVSSRPSTSRSRSPDCTVLEGCVSVPDTPPIRRLSRVSCPTPQRDRSPSPSAPRKNSLPLERPL